MSDVVSAIREQIRHHEREIERLKRMLDAGGAASVSSVREVILAQLGEGPKTVSEMLAVAQCKPNSFYVQMSRMKKTGDVVRLEDGRYALP